MKKIFSFVLLFIYLISSVGVLFNFQYCCGQLKTVELFSLAAPSEIFQEKCQQQDQDMGKDCCKNDIKVVKTENDQNKTSLFQILCPAYPIKISIFSFQAQTDAVSASAITFQTSMKIKRRTYLDNCVLII